MNLLDLSNDLEKFTKEFENEVNEFTKRFIETLLAELTTVTPADTTKALSNWQIGINSPVSDGPIDPYVAGRGGDTQPESARAAYEAGKAILQAKRSGNVVYISNLADYIVYLNEGTSYQAPAGFIEIAIAKVERQFEGKFKIKVL